MRKRYLLIFLILSSCSSLKILRCNLSSKCYKPFTDQDSKIFEKFSNADKETFLLEEYDTYVLSLCEGSSFLLEEGHIEDLSYPVINNCETNTSKKIIEQNYLLLPKDENDTNVLYITSFSHKYIDNSCGVFNCPEFKDKYFLEDIDYVYLGQRINNKIVFPQGKMGESNWEINKEDNIISIEAISLPSRSTNLRNKIPINQIFSTDLVFYKKNMELQFGKASYSQCYKPENSDCSIIKPDIPKGINIQGQVRSVYLTESNLYFQSEKDGQLEYYRFSKKKVKS